MSFVTLEKRVSVTDLKAPASMSMRTYKGSKKPIAFVVFRGTFLNEAPDIAKAKHFEVAIGDGTDAGKIGITPSAKGPFVARRLKSGTFIIDLGHVPQLGMQPHKNHGADVALVDGTAVVTVPDWSDESEGGDDDDDDHEAEEIVARPAPRAAPVAPPSAAAPTPVVKAARHPNAVKSVEHNGVIVDLTPGNEAVSYRGETVDVSPRGAQMVVALARVMPTCIGDGFLIGKLWTIKPAGGAASLDMVARDLSSLKKLGLEIRNQRGIGRQLVEIA